MKLEMVSMKKDKKRLDFTLYTAKYKVKNKVWSWKKFSFVLVTEEKEAIAKPVLWVDSETGEYLRREVNAFLNLQKMKL